MDSGWTLEDHPTIKELIKPLMPYIRDKRVTEISINSFGEIWLERIERGYGTSPEPASWCEAGWAWMLCQALANMSGNRFPTSPDDLSFKPILSLVLPGRHRLHAILGRSVPSGITLSIRLFRPVENLSWKTFNVEAGLANRLSTMIAEGATVLVSGGVGSGKSTLLHLLSQYIPRHRRVFVVGDLDELDLPHPNQPKLMLNRFSRGDEPGYLDYGDMIDSVLRLNGAAIVLNELSRDNAVPAFRLLNTGALAGFMTTMHSNSPLDALEAWRRNVAMSEGPQGSGEVVSYLARTVDVLVHCKRTGVDSREVTGVAWKDTATGELDIPWRRLLSGTNAL
jgi:type IV secretory pathway ATPase VirB11/archaellum biosynthesis ATPase